MYMNNVWAAEECAMCDEVLDENLQAEDCEVCNPDMVNSPPHYNTIGIECIEAIEAASTKEEFEGYLRSNVIKYIWRFRYKDNIKDLRKARWYLDKLIGSVGKLCDD